MNNEDYIKNLINEMMSFIAHLKIRAGIVPNEEFCVKVVENASPEEIEKFNYFYDNAIKIIDYYSLMKKSTNYINEFSDLIGTMLFLLGSNISNDFSLLDKFYDKVQEYNTVLLDNNMSFNRALISCSILYDDFPEQNEFIQKLKNSIVHLPLTNEELKTISKFSASTTQIWKCAKLL